MATARLRKAFHYVEDSDNEHLREELDEEEQEQVIKHLQKQNDQGNAKYSMIFTVVPLLSGIVFIPSMLSITATLNERFLSLVSIISLSATAYAMKQFPVSLSASKSAGAKSIDLAKTVFFANSGTCLLLALAYALISPAELKIRPVLYLIPGAMFIATLAVQKVMGSVDPSPLEALRYEYKGP